MRAYVTALPVALKQQAKEEAYRVYVTEALRVIAENTAKLSQGGYLKSRYVDLISSTPSSTTHTEKTENEVITDIKNKLRWIGGGE